MGSQLRNQPQLSCLLLLYLNAKDKIFIKIGWMPLLADMRHFFDADSESPVVQQNAAGANRL